jgi:hypothetical protein
MTTNTQKTLWILAAAAVLALLGWADYATRYQIGFAVFYAIPIAWIAWSVNFSWAFFLISCDTLVRIWTDAHWVHHYAHTWIPWERACMRTIIFAFIAYSFHQFRRDLDRKSRKLKQLEGILPVCIACNRISDGTGHWTDLGTYLRRHSAARPETQLCPECTSVRYQ